MEIPPPSKNFGLVSSLADCGVFLIRGIEPPSVDVDWRVFIIDDMVLLCVWQEGLPRKTCRIRRIRARKGHLDDAGAERHRTYVSDTI